MQSLMKSNHFVLIILEYYQRRSTDATLCFIIVCDKGLKSGNRPTFHMIQLLTIMLKLLVQFFGKSNNLKDLTRISPVPFYR